MNSAAAIELRALTKDYSIGLRGVKLRALDGLTLRIEAGEIFGLLGPNGSGKSTAIKIILGLLAPTAGECAVFGAACDRIESRLAVGYLPESPEFYRYLTGRELVRFHAALGGVKRAAAAARAAEVIESVGLTAAADRRVGTYSKGMLQRIGLAQALVHDPRLLILDEPTAGVDPIGAAAMVELILRLKARGKTILITSHLLGQMEELCDRVAILDRGRLILQGTMVELIDRSAALGGSPRVRLDRLFIEQVGRNSPAASA